jgi:hypothetical protein
LSITATREVRGANSFRSWKVAAWREAMARRASVRTAVGADYDQRLLDFIVQRHSALSRRACSLCRNAARLPNQVALG